MSRGLIDSGWMGRMQERGDLVKLFREYADGQHRLKITREMRKMVGVSDARLDQYNANYCEMVISGMADRLTVDTVEATSGAAGAGLVAYLEGVLPAGADVEQIARDLAGRFGALDDAATNPAQEWADMVLQANRFDGLQIDVREAALRDGETFVMVAYDEAAGRPVLAHEMAWDGDVGTMVVYDRQMRHIVAGVKVWYEGDIKRVNLYYPNSTEKMSYEAVEVERDGLTVEEMRLVQYRPTEDTTREGQVPGVPIIHFANKGKRKARSELVNVIPLQDSLNSTLVSMVMTALLTAFPHLFAKGWEPPSGITPGMIFHAAILDPETGKPVIPESEEHARALAALISQYDLKRIEPGEIDQLIKQADWLIGQIGTISSTPVPSQMGGDAQSGEALKQRDTRLLGKIQRAQVQFGNAWEDVLMLAHRQQTLFAAQRPPEIEHLTTRWKAAEIRNDTEIREIARLLNEMGFEREALRALSQTSVIDFSEDDIRRMIREKRDDAAAALTAAAGSLPGLEFAFE